MNHLCLYIVANPTAGSGKGDKVTKEIIEYLETKQIAYQLFFTEYAGHGRIIIEHLLAKNKIFQSKFQSAVETSNQIPILTIIGGDGSLHEAVSTVQTAKAHIPLGYIPAGSGNDFARACGISTSPKKALQQLLTAKKPIQLTIGHYFETQLKTGWFVNNVGIGFDASIVDRANNSDLKTRLNKYRMGSLAYLSAVMQVFQEQQGFLAQVNVDGKQYNFKKAFLCTTTNHPYFGGGVPIAPNASVHQSDLDVIIVEKPSIFRLLFLASLVALKKPDISKYFHHFTGKEIKVDVPSTQTLQADGEITFQSSYHFNFSLAYQLFWYCEISKLA